jgi:hypothetical protein
MDKCPHCGSDEYYVKQSFHGTCNYYTRFDGEESDNSEMHSNTVYKYTSKYAWCSKCHKKLFELDKK